MGKVRHIKYHPDEFLMGVAGMPPEQVGLYWLLCSVIYSRGGPIPDDNAENARILRLDVRQYKRLKAALIERGKIRQEAGCLTNSRCEFELAMAHGRIESNGINGRQGGRPRKAATTDPADLSGTSPELLGEVSDTSAGSVRDVGDKSASVLNGGKGLAKATGFLGRNLTSNQKPVTIKEEESPPSIDGERDYAFAGKIIRLTHADFDRWRVSYAAIPDLRAQLQSEDDWYDANLSGKDRAKWFTRVSAKLRKVNADYLQSRQARGGGPSLNESF